jgi:hypothetical protein
MGGPKYKDAGYAMAITNANGTNATKNIIRNAFMPSSRCTNRCLAMLIDD